MAVLYCPKKIKKLEFSGLQKLDIVVTGILLSCLGLHLLFCVGWEALYQLPYGSHSECVGLGTAHFLT